ncbi:MAG: AraC family transcriptional regulator [Phycisphaeraceae bacterium]|nr:AraC family transcriptional regulator [Phycisphaeraceae bacterium]
MKKELLKLVDESLGFHYVRGGEKTVAINSTTWAANPENVLSSMISDGEVSLVYQGIEKPVKRRKGDTFFIPAGIVRRSVRSDPTKHLYCWAHLQFTILYDIDLLGLLELKPIFFPKKASEQLTIWLKELARLYRLDPNRENFESMVTVKSLGFSILGTLLDHSRTEINITDKLVNLDRFSPVFIYISNHLDQKISLSKLAEQVNLSPFHFHRKFKQAIGFSPLEYARRRKTKRAQELLLSTDWPLSEIADALGFPDPFTFSKSFKQRTGFAPKDYRRNTFAPI